MIDRLLTQWIDFIRDHLYVITILIFISLIGLLFVQYNLIKLEVDIQKRHFDKEIDGVLLDMHHRIEDDEQLSNNLIQLLGDKLPVYQRDSLEESTVTEIRSFTDSILTNRKLGYLDYDFAFYQRYEDTIAFTSAINPYQPDYQKYAFRAGWRIREAYGKGIFRFGLLFHNQSMYIIYQIYSILAITTLFILILLGSFFSTFMVLNRQKQISKLKNDFINNLTHELKTPIFASSILFKIIKEKRHNFSEEELDHYLSLLENENHLLKNKVEKVLELIVLERENPGLHLIEIDLHELIARKIEIFKIIIQEREGAMHCNLNANKFIISGDTMHIGNIIDNLLDNAIKYSDEAPEIEISTRNLGDYLILEISDKGIGVESTDIPFVFDKFYRVSQGNLHQTKGFGLGLSYVKMITELLGGTLTFDSKLGRGSTITLQFPLKNNSNSNRHGNKNIIG